MGKVIAFTVELNGIKGAVTDGHSLAKAIKATNDEVKKADFGSGKYKELQKQLGALKKIQADQRAEVRKQGREFEISADKGKRSYRAMNAELVNLRSSFKELSETERNSQIGKDLIKRIRVLDTELKDLDASIGNHHRNIGNYASAFEGLSGIDISNLMTIPGALAAGGAAAAEAAKFVKELTDEFRQLRGEVQNLTGATGDDLDEFTTRIAAISETFEQPFSDVLEAANALTDQLTGDFSESLTLIENGFIGGLDSSDEFLRILKEYPTFFDEAGLSGDQFLNIINRQVENGIFSDKGVDAVKEASIRLRELTGAAQDALSNIGISAEDIRRTIDEEGIGGAIEKVSQRLNDFSDDSQEVGQVIADVFGGAGEDAGVAFIKSLTDISGATDELIDKSNQYQLQQQETLRVNQEFAAVQNDLAKQLGGTSSSFDNLGTIMQTKALKVLLLLIQGAQTLWVSLQPVRDALFNLAQAFGLIDSSGSATAKVMAVLKGIMQEVSIVWNLFGQAIGFVINQVANFTNKLVDALEWLGVLDDDATKAAKATNDLSEAHAKAADQVKRQAEEQAKSNQSTKSATKEYKDYKDQLQETEKAIKKLTDSTKQSAIVTDKFAKDSISALRKEVSDLKKELDDASEGDAKGILSKLLNAEEALNEAEQFRKDLRSVLTTDSIDTVSISSLQISDLGGVQETADKEVEINQDKINQILEQERLRAEEVKAIQNEIFSSINSAIGIASDVSETRYNNEVEALENRYEREIMLAEGNEQLQEELEEQLAQKREELRQREFNRQKKFRVASALSSLAQGVINILSAPTTIPDPFGAIFKGIQIGIMTATTLAQIAKIQSQKAALGTLVESQINSDSLGFSRLGIARGATHGDKSGGIPAVFHGKPFLIEHGEAVDIDEFGNIAVINKRSTAALGGMIKKNMGKVFPGKRSLLSDINSYKNYGVSFAQEGALVKPDVQSLVPGPSAGLASTTVVRLELSDAQLLRLEAANREGARQGAKDGTMIGLDSANRAAEREQRRNERAGTS